MTDTTRKQTDMTDQGTQTFTVPLPLRGPGAKPVVLKIEISDDDLRTVRRLCQTVIGAVSTQLISNRTGAALRDFARAFEGRGRADR